MKTHLDLGPLLILFGFVCVGLKLAGIVTWSWLWVLCPFWLPLVPVAIFMGFVAFILACIACLAIAGAIFAVLDDAFSK